MFNRVQYINEPLPIQKELETLFDKREALTIFEIGACEGEESIKYARFFPNAKIYSFEPLPKNVNLIVSNLKKYNIQNVNVINKALSDKSGIAEFFVSSGSPKDVIAEDWDFGNKSSSLLAPDKVNEAVDFIEFRERIVVETITLDSYCQQNKIDSIDFIHMDVQGAELMVLKGAVGKLNNIKAIWLEVSVITLYKDQPLAEDVENFFEEAGFVMVKDSLEGISGDRLYISKKYFPAWKKKNTLLTRILQKIGL